MAEITTTIPAYYPVLDGKGHWVSQDELGFRSTLIGKEITIPAGSVNDLASIPRIFRMIFPVNGPHRLAAAIHDYIYLKKGVLPEGVVSRYGADCMFYEAMVMSRSEVAGAYTFEAIESNDEPLVPTWCAKLMYAGVRLGGWIYWNRKPKG